MKRAAIIIGVDRTGGMPPLRDAAKGARRFEDWALSQKFDSIHVFTDEDDSVVEVGAIKRAIKKMVDTGTFEQLVIYFAGHGVNIGYGEYWLLSDAPGDPQAAVNIRSSTWQAEYSGIPHTIFISDACRTAAEGGTTQRVTGSEIFPNDGVGGLAKPVDIFYACTLGRPALEIRDRNVAAGAFTALYTSAFLDVLQGKHAELLEWKKEAGKSVAYVRPRPLKPHLTAEVPRRITQLKLQATAIQEPDARIVSDDTAWIARLTEEEGFTPPRPTAFSIPIRRSNAYRAGVKPALAPVTAASAACILLRSVLKDGIQGIMTASEPPELITRRRTRSPKLTTLDKDSVACVATLNSLARKAAIPFGPPHQETHCGFKIRGAKFVKAWCNGSIAEVIDQPGDLIRMHNVPTPSTSVLLELENGTGMLLPAIPGFLAGLTVEDGELIDVAYEPSDNTSRWDTYRQHAADLRALRAVASSATRSGVFRLENEDALEIMHRMQHFKSVDPSLAIYATYAYHDIRLRELIQQISNSMRDDLGARLFDIALLAGELHKVQIGASKDQALISPFPLLAQGWALLAAQAVTLPDALKDIQCSLLPSVWTLFNPEGVRKIQTAIEQREII
ncbi:caspase domain-containing protein [Prosthecobacter fusiformis]|uniref:Caspase domain-containing protein n=1 Tax=Prosthecobacter fusiformis TaxID=48464 RepID=A0A4R7SRI9_9BACT|nr:caspase family protein [Prosthecobacter fusiformis]TDU80777.1 caspase domain-containing protein [Prosthecobacter fusiformis]